MIHRKQAPYPARFAALAAAGLSLALALTACQPGARTSSTTETTTSATSSDATTTTTTPPSSSETTTTAPTSSEPTTTAPTTSEPTTVPTTTPTSTTSTPDDGDGQLLPSHTQFDGTVLPPLDLGTVDMRSKLIDIARFIMHSPAQAKELRDYMSEMAYYSTDIDYIGVKADFVEVISVESSMSPSNYVFTLLRVPPGADVAALAAEVKAKADLMKWVCMGADAKDTFVRDDLILLVMGSQEQIDDGREAFEQLPEG